MKLIDFGLAEITENGWVIDVLGSPFWIAPEMIQLKPHGPPVDIWAFAISILEVLFLFFYYFCGFCEKKIKCERISFSFEQVINGHPPHEENALCALYYAGTIGVAKPIENPSSLAPPLFFSFFFFPLSLSSD